MRRIRKWFHSAGIALIAAVAGQALVAGSASGQIFTDDWNSTAPGQLPDSVVVLQGTAGVSSRDGAKVLRVGPNTTGKFTWTVLEVRLGTTLPDEFTIEFDLHAPLSTSYPLEIRAALAGDPLAYLGATARQNRVVANCGAVRTGVYGNLQNTLGEKQDRFDTTGVHRCRVAVTGNRVEVEYAAVTLAQDNVDFKRSNRIALVVPARAGTEAHIGPLTVSGPPAAVAEVTIPPPTTAMPPTTATPPAPATRTAGHVTGGGWITLPADVRANFGFVIRSTAEGATPTGNFQLNWRGARGANTFRSTSFTDFAPGSTTTFSGTGTLNGQAGYAFSVTAIEGTPNLMRIRITPAAGEISDTGSHTVEGGDITVHRQ